MQANLEKLILHVAETEGTDNHQALVKILVDFRHVANKLNIDFDKAVKDSWIINDPIKADLILAVKRLLTVAKGHPADKQFCVAESESLLKRIT